MQYLARLTLCFVALGLAKDLMTLMTVRLLWKYHYLRCCALPWRFSSKNRTSGKQGGFWLFFTDSQARWFLSFQWFKRHSFHVNDCIKFV